MKQFLQTLKSFWSDKWVKFGIVSAVFILIFVIWNRSLWWLLFVPVIYDLYISKNIQRIFLNPYRAYKKQHTVFRKTMEWVEALLYAMVVVIPLKIFFFGMYVIPSSSMEQTLLVGDYIYVNKVHYGPKMPNTPISFPFVHNTLPFSRTKPSYVEGIQRPYKRLKGTDQIKRDDVVVFNFPEGDTVALGTMRVYDPYGRMVESDVSIASYYDLTRSFGREEVKSQTKVLYRPVDKRENYIKRCVALAGDTIQVIDGDVFVNGIRQKTIPGVKHRYLITTTEPLGSRVLDRLDINPEEVQYMPDASRYVFSLNAAGVELLRSLPQVTAVERSVSRLPYDGIFPHDPTNYPWTEDLFGPLWVPQAGQTVRLDMTTLPLYERVIRNYELNQLEVRDSTIYINGEVSNSYTFQMDYYFMMGDNRHNSADSRFWGFVPIDHVEGRASFIWFSIEQGKNLFNGVRWKRLFKGIR